MMRSISRSLALLLCVISFATLPAFGQDISDSGITEAEQAAFTRGQSLYNHGLYGEAIVTLNDFLTHYPSSTIKDLGLLWLGRSYLAQGDIANAEKVGLRLKDIPDTPLASLYEDELRVGRQSFAKSVTPKHSSKREVVRALLEPQPAEAVKAKDPEAVATTTVPSDIEQPKLKTTEQAVEKSTGPVATVAAPKVADKPKSPSPAQKEPLLLAVTPVSKETTTAAKPLVRPGLAIINPPTAVKSFQPAPPAPKTVQPPPVITGVALTTRSEKAPEKPAEKLAPPKLDSAAAPAAHSVAASRKESVKSGPPAIHSRFEADTAQGSYRLLMVNDGKGRASDLTIRVELDPFATYISSDLLPSRQEMIGQRQVLTFRVPAVEARETKTIEIEIRAPSISPTKSPIKHSIFYKDNQGQFLHTP